MCTFTSKSPLRPAARRSGDAQWPGFGCRHSWRLSIPNIYRQKHTEFHRDFDDQMLEMSTDDLLEVGDGERGVASCADFPPRNEPEMNEKSPK